MPRVRAAGNAIGGEVVEAASFAAAALCAGGIATAGAAWAAVRRAQLDR